MCRSAQTATLYLSIVALRPGIVVALMLPARVRPTPAPQKSSYLAIGDGTRIPVEE
jgi:hypothetical protein